MSVFKVLVKVIIENNSKILVLKVPPDDPFPDTWDFPGGNLESGESIEHAALREVMEESNLLIYNIDLFDVSSMNIENTTYITIIYKSNNFSGNIKISSEHIEFKWTDPKELNKNNLNPVLLHSIDKLKLKRGYYK